jgi:hypothetical protein
MATKKKTKKKQPKSKRTSGRKVAPMKNEVEKKVAKKRVTLKKKLAKKKSAPKKVVAQTKVGGKKTTSGKTAGSLKKQAQGKSQSVDTVAFALEGLGVRAGNREICRDCPTSKVRIRRVWTSCSSKETRSRPTW